MTVVFWLFIVEACLLVVVCWSLRDVRCWLSVVCCLLCVACVFEAWYALCVVCCALVVVRRLVVVRWLPCGVCCVLFAVWCLLCVGCCSLSC